MVSSIGSATGDEPRHDITDFQIVLTVSVENADALWCAALRRHHQMAEELTLDDIAESIGPREDPVIEDCLTTIALSTAFDGCLVNDIKVHSSEVMILKPEQIHMPIALPALPPAFDRASHHYQISPLGSEPTVRTAPHIASDQGGGFSASPR